MARSTYSRLEILTALLVAAISVAVGWHLVANRAGRGPALITYGDSIVVAKGTPLPWPRQLGATVDAVSGRALADDPGAAERIARARPVQVWIAIGTNDYGKSKSTPAEFKAAYSAMVDEIHERSPGTWVFAQTPLVRKSEGPNQLGAALWEYRQAIIDICSTRRWVTCVDGQSILSLADMPDGLHPGSAAQQRYAAYVDLHVNP